MFGNVKSTDKTTFHMIKFWMNMHMKEKKYCGEVPGRKSFLALSQGLETNVGAGWSPVEAA